MWSQDAKQTTGGPNVFFLFRGDLRHLQKYIRSTWLFRQVGCLVETRLRCVCHGFTLPAIQSPMGRLLAKACTGAPGVLATAGWTWLSIRQSSVRNAGGGSAMISNSFGEEFGWQARKCSARNSTGRLNNFRRVPPRDWALRRDFRASQPARPLSATRRDCSPRS